MDASIFIISASTVTLFEGFLTRDSIREYCYPRFMIKLGSKPRTLTGLGYGVAI